MKTWQYIPGMQTAKDLMSIIWSKLKVTIKYDEAYSTHTQIPHTKLHKDDKHWDIKLEEVGEYSALGSNNLGPGGLWSL